MNQTVMKEKAILPLVLSMSLPMVLSMMVNALYNIVDSYFVARISEDAMTALSLVFPLQNLMGAVAIGFGIGINAVISFYLGAKKEEKVNEAATNGMVLSGIHGLVLMVLCIVIMPTFLSLFTKEAMVIEYGIRYSGIIFSFSAIVGVQLSFEKIFQAVGRMMTSMIAMLVGCILNIILDPILIFGWGFVPALGIEGAAIATVTGQLVTLIVYLVLFIKKPIPVKIQRKYLTWNKQICKKIYAVGIPATLNMALTSILVTALNAILAAFSTSYVLVLGAYYKLQTFLYLSANGIVQGIRPLVGYNYGAGENKRVMKIYWTSLGMTAVIMAVGTILCMAIPDRLIGLFTDNGETIMIGADALRIISIGFVVSTISVITSGALEGLGKGMPSLVISLMRYIVVILPAAFILSRFWGAAGVWHAFWITEVISAVVSWILFRRSLSHEAQREQ
ncbi:MAG: MATE family efflux transporter [Clostridia bacterium]|nr:MATE family efflux transporter [Clostridia bacterium]NCC42035.1 MATE family efflux transporter [Clostridia bacterium]